MQDPFIDDLKLSGTVMVDQLPSWKCKSTLFTAVGGLVSTFSLKVVLQSLSKEAYLALRVVDALSRRLDTFVIRMIEELSLRQFLVAKLTLE